MHLKIVHPWDKNYPNEFGEFFTELVTQEVKQLQKNGNIDTTKLSLKIPQVKGFYTALWVDTDFDCIRFDVFTEDKKHI